MHGLSKFLPLIIILALIGLFGSGFFFYQYQKSQQDLTSMKKTEIQKLVEEVGKLVVLPIGEEPTLATVTDIDKLKSQSFFQQAKNGDKVLIYLQAKKAILYDPVVHKVIEIAPINNSTSSAAQASPSATPALAQIKTVLRNGTSTTGLTVKVEANIKQNFPQIEVVTKENAANFDYSKTIIIVLNEVVRKDAEGLANYLKAELKTLPTGESKPKNADLLIIIGKDQS